MSKDKGENLVYWKLIVMIFSIISVAYGVILIGAMKLNEPIEIQDQIIQIPLVDVFFTGPILELQGKITTTNDIYVNTPFKLDLSVESRNSQIQNIVSVIIPDRYHELDTTSSVRVLSSYQNEILNLVKKNNSTIFEGNSENFILSKPGLYSILILGYNNQSDLISQVLSHDQFNVLDMTKKLEAKSAKENIRNAATLEGLSWIVVGATGIIFLSQIGLKDE